jgi:hypothetical protein
VDDRQVRPGNRRSHATPVSVQPSAAGANARR